jgi:hypothetical protein
VPVTLASQLSFGDAPAAGSKGAGPAEVRKRVQRETVLKRRLLAQLRSAGSVGALFARLDTDGDGSVDSEEFRNGVVFGSAAAAPAASVGGANQRAMGAAEIRILFDEIDVNHDGKLSLAELQDYLQSPSAAGTARGVGLTTGRPQRATARFPRRTGQFTTFAQKGMGYA